MKRLSSITSSWERLQLSESIILLDGFHAIKHALRFGGTLEIALTTNSELLQSLSADLAPDVGQTLMRLAIKVDSGAFRSLVGRIHQTEVAALARKPTWLTSVPRSSERPAPAILLEEPKNLGNLGAAIRVAAGMDLSGVFSTGTVDPWDPTVLRGSAGLHYALPVERLEAIGDVSGPVYALDSSGEDIREVRIPDNALLAFGSERNGISQELRSYSDALVSIPMRDSVSSYNLTTSVAMAAYHWSASKHRQTR